MQPLYPHSQEEFSPEIFNNPPAEYRGTPFWSWNNKLDLEQLKRQIEVFKEMGLGGAHMHVRTGLATEYLSDEFMDIVAGCVDKFEQEGMLAWLYDEDRWPSGAAGGLVTKDEKYRANHLLLTRTPYSPAEKNTLKNFYGFAEGFRQSNGSLIAVYGVEFTQDGCLESYKRIEEKDIASFSGVVWYVYLEQLSPTTWFNNQGYVDTLNPEAIAKFIEVTYERYKQKLGDKFGKSVPAIFTDEPQFTRRRCFRRFDDTEDLTIPFTGNFADTFKKEYGYDILDKLPEILWEKKDGTYSTARYHFNQHVCERFNNAFCDQIGKWCEQNGIMFTGHMNAEETLYSQCTFIGDAMRAYEHFQLPGIDMLCAKMELTTAKQAQSASRQYGRPGVLSELYGVSGWDYDFNGHKQQGDWQAALGVTVRVQHLAWVSMEGEAKRDYPASIFYQSPWWKKYRVVEDHFARVNYAMTRGKAVCNIGVLHPIESLWLNFGTEMQTVTMREDLDTNFQNLTEWLIFSLQDFDFINESLLPRQKTDFSNASFKLGEMDYKVILVPGMQTIRSTTLDKLEAFVGAGGELIFIGNIPEYVDAVKSDRAIKLANKCQCIPYTRGSILNSISKHREVKATNSQSMATKVLVYQMRQDGKEKYLFVCNTSEDALLENVELSIKGEYSLELLDTQTGEVSELPSMTQDGYTRFYYTFQPVGSLLLKLIPTSKGNHGTISKTESVYEEFFHLSSPVKVTLDEPNTLLLDQAKWRVDQGQWQPVEELLRIESKVRESAGIEIRGGRIAQPWTETPDTTSRGEVEVSFKIDCKVDVPESWLAIENPQNFAIALDGKPVEFSDCGWWVDECLRKTALPAMNMGIHELTLRCAINDIIALEWCYLLGDFGVKVRGREACIVEPVRKLTFGDYTVQGLPFYTGNLTYHCEADIPQQASHIKVPHFKGAMVSAIDQDNTEYNMAYAPYEFPVKPGKQKFDITLWGTRQNAFGCLHRVPVKGWLGPAAWRTEGNDWSYEYRLRPAGILSSPRVINIQSKQQQSSNK